MKPVTRHVVALHFVGLLAFSAHAQDKPEPAPPAGAKADPAKDFKAIESRMDKILPPARGKEDRTPPISALAPPPELREKLQEILNDYVSYCELKARHEAALSERKYRKLAERVEANRLRWLNYMQQEVGVELDGPPGGEKHSRTRLYNAMAGGAVLSKKDPTGTCMLFSGVIENVRREADVELAKVRIESATSDISCFVIVPAGVRWVPDAKLRVVGRVVDVSRYPALKADVPEAVVVQPLLGTE